MKRPLLLATALAGVFAFAALDSRAALTFNLDPAAKTFFFVGSTSGTPNPNFADGRVTWEAIFAFDSPTAQNVSIDAGVVPDSGLSVFNNSFFRVVTGQVPQVFRIEIFPQSTAFQEIAGNGVPISYASLNAQHQASLETFVSGAGTFNLTQGGGFEPIQTFLVPEPGTLALLAAAALGFGLATLRITPRGN